MPFLSHFLRLQKEQFGGVRVTLTIEEDIVRKGRGGGMLPSGARYCFFCSEVMVSMAPVAVLKRILVSTFLLKSSGATGSMRPNCAA